MPFEINGLAQVDDMDVVDLKGLDQPKTQAQLDGASA
jgi:hypothetical protein